MEFSEGHILTLLDLAFGLLRERAFGRRQHVVRIDQVFRLDDDRTPALRYRHKIARPHVEVLEDVPRDNHLAPLPNAADPFFSCNCFLGHCSQLIGLSEPVKGRPHVIVSRIAGLRLGLLPRRQFQPCALK